MRPPGAAATNVVAATREWEDRGLIELWQMVLAAFTAAPRVAQDRRGEVRAARRKPAADAPAGLGRAAGRRVFTFLRHKMVMLMVGGALGTAARHLVGKWFGAQPWAQGFPVGTLVINVSGSFLLAVAAVVILERLPPEHQDWFLLVGTGFCGGYTTFSTFEWETFKLVRDGSWLPALANVTGSVLAGFVGVLLGVLVAALVFPKR